MKVWWRSLYYNLEHAIESVDDQVATLKLRVATLNSKKASLAKAEADYNRNKPLVATGAITQQDMDAYTEALLVAQAEVQQALEAVYEIRASLGLPPAPPSGNDLVQVPPDLNQTFSSVREAQARLMQAAAALGVTGSFNNSPRKMVEEFYKRDPKGNIDRIYAKLLEEAPAVKQAEAKLLQAQHNLDDAKLNLRYCKVYAEIDGVVTRRNVNPGNNVVAGQSLMAIRSITEIWIDANFKETQLATLRIGQPVTIEVDMYGRHHEFTGRHFRLHDGNRLDVGAVATPKCDWKFCESGSAAAGPYRSDELRSEQGPAIHWIIGDAVRPHSREANGSKCWQVSSAAPTGHLDR